MTDLMMFTDNCRIALEAKFTEILLSIRDCLTLESGKYRKSSSGYKTLA